MAAPHASTPPSDVGRTSWTIAISGSTGLIGSALVESLRRDGHRIRRITRSETGTRSEHVAWNPDTETLDPAALEGVDAVIHLAGENVGERWTEEKKRKIRDSRVKGTRLLAAAIASLERRPQVMVNAGGIGIYGDRGDEVLDESTALGPATDFLAQVGREWEGAAEPAERHGIRVVKLRMGVVLSPTGGALERLLLPFRMGVGGKLGSGKQWMSWVAMTDVVEAIRFALANPGLQGPINLVAPEPVTNAEFTRALGRVLGRPTLFTVPAPALQLVFGEMAGGTLLASQRAVPRRLLEAGFEFRYPTLDEALRAELGRSSTR
jgi:uncharacterized protein